MRMCVTCGTVVEKEVVKAILKEHRAFKGWMKNNAHKINIPGFDLSCIAIIEEHFVDYINSRSKKVK